MARRATGVSVDALYSTPNSQNTWAMLSGGTAVPGFTGTFAGGGEWIKVRELSTDGVTNTFGVLVAAQATDSFVEAETSGTTGSTAERIFRVWKPAS